STFRISHASSVNIVLGIATLRLIIFGETIIPRCYAGCFSYKDQQPLAHKDNVLSLMGLNNLAITS
ncbi:hypothetical protein, partial [Alteromonas sp.]|uniref:hypothetical protein n=1 Tax=Alteromonas sp. TaxID=232 RepID=UPI00257E7CEC